MRWRRNPRRDLYWRDWGGDSVVFEQRSGHTYQFAPLAAAVMACFEQDDCSLGDLTALLAADMEVAPDNALTESLRAIVAQFESLGWIEAINDHDT